jgi:hypothetical protein
MFYYMIYKVPKRVCVRCLFADEGRNMKLERARGRKYTIQTDVYMNDVGEVGVSRAVHSAYSRT